MTPHTTPPPRHPLWKIILLLLTLLLMGAPAHAQEGGGQQLSETPTGPYLLSVWVSPNPPRPGPVHVIATLKSLTGEPVIGPQITITANALHRDRFQTVMAPEDDGYVADFDIPYSGPWRFDLSVQGEEGTGSASFTTEIQPHPINKNLIRLGAFATLVVLATGWWFWGRHPRKKRVRKRIFMSRPDEDD